MKLKIAVLFGGQSVEHEVSRMSAASVLNNIDKEKYDVYRIGITKDGQWIEYNGSVDNIENGKWEHDECYKAPDGYKLIFNHEVDVVFPVLHGLYGEDGTIQGLCKLAKIPCVSCSVLSSALIMDKAFTRFVADKFCIKQTEYIVISEYQWEMSKNTLIDEIEKNLKYDIFIKPSNGGSSIGISKAHNREELLTGIENAFKYDRKVILENGLNAIDVEVAVIGNNEPKASIPGQIVPANEFYDYNSKYENEKSFSLVPPDLPSKMIEKLKDLAVKIYKIYDCSGMARVDFMIDKETSEIYFNELNTIPGFTKISLYPVLWERSGKPYNILIDDLVSLAIERNNR